MPREANSVPGDRPEVDRKPLDHTVATPDIAPGGPPVKYKSALIVFAIILPLVHFVPPNVGRVITGPRLLVEVITVLIIVSLMTWVFMPLAQRVLGNWMRR